jgi:drug/metabolite transporter (DMT)-like permease
LAYIIQFLLFVAPFAGFLAWRRLNPERPVPAGLIWALAAAILCGIAGAVWYGQSVSLAPGSVYVPAQLGPDGQVMPHRVEPSR